MLFVNVAELGLLLAAVVLPVVLGMVSAFMRRPWWWAAIVAVVVAMVAAIAPTPEPGKHGWWRGTFRSCSSWPP